MAAVSWSSSSRNCRYLSSATAALSPLLFSTSPCEISSLRFKATVFIKFKMEGPSAGSPSRKSCSCCCCCCNCCSLSRYLLGVTVGALAGIFAPEPPSSEVEFPLAPVSRAIAACPEADSGESTGLLRTTRLSVCSFAWIG